jgi:predicted Ser/Thr protein kinase
MSTCPACSRNVPEGSRYCPTCGAALVEGEEVRPSTVVVDSSMLLAGDTPDPIDHGSFLPGTIIAERYRVVGLLGKGGMGEVYRADDLKLGQTVALKFLPADLADDPRRRERFRNEVRIARQVAHPNLCRVYDIGEVEGHTYLSMEYVDGEDLSSLLRRIGRVPRAKAVEIALQLCAGLAASHERGILHHDLKPANVMIDGRGKVRITDFGLAAWMDDLSGPAARSGTPPYMAPEQVTGKEFTVRSEVYTLGLVLYELFTGKRAFTAESVEDYARLHTEVIPVKPSQIVASVDPAVERVILQCLEKDPALRPVSPTEVAAALPGRDPLAAALAAGETPSPELVAASTPRESIRPAVGAACLAVILVGAAVFPFINDDVKLHAFIPLDKSPEVLTDRARQIIDVLGYSRRPADWACGFAVSEAYLDHIEAHDRSTTRWAKLATGRPAVMEFWYRQSEDYLAPNNMLGTVTPSDPPPLKPQMVSVRLDSQGRLLSLQVVPESQESRGAWSREPDWPMLFEQAQLNRERFQPTRPERVPPVYCDRRAAWVSASPDSRDVPLRVEAGAYHGKPVYFEVVPELDDRGDTDSPGLSAPQAGQAANIVLLLVCLAGTAALARRNLLQGRGDRRGAFRVAVLMSAPLMLAWALQANHVPNVIDELRLLAVTAGLSLVSAGLCWLLYIALEPYVRQRWPDMLISWNRLLANRFRDPVIGRDILIGGVFGILGVLLITVLHFAPGWFGASPARPVGIPNLALLGFRYDIAQYLQIVVAAVVAPMVLLLLLLLLLVLLRRRWVALLTLFALLTAIATLVTMRPGDNVYANVVVCGMIAASMLFLLMRFGLLAVVIAVFYILLLHSYPITADWRVWYAEASLFAMALATGLALYGFYTSLSHRKLLRNITAWD